MNKFQKAVQEAMDFQDKPDVWNPDIKREIESGQQEVLGALPSQEYLDFIHSEEYIDLIERIARLTGIREEQITTQRVPSIIARAGEAFAYTERVERQHSEFFKNLALEVVLDLPEFRHVKALYEEGKIKFDIQHGKGDMQRQEQQDVPEELEQEAEEEAEQLEDEEETTEMEKNEFDLAHELMDDTEKQLRRRLANSLMQGNAVNKFQLYHLVTDRINEIDPQLINKYAITTTLPQLAYHNAPSFMFPGDENPEGEDDGEGEEGAIGSEDVSFDEDGTPIIKVRGINFPLLCHELTKGIYEFLAYNNKETDIGRHNPKVERMDTLHGVPLWKKFAAMIPLDKQDLTPSIYQKFISLADDEDYALGEGQSGIDKIKAVFAGGEAGRRAMDSIINDVETDLQKQQQEYDDYHNPEYNDSGEE
jgi:hypothetical protein